MLMAYFKYRAMETKSTVYPLIMQLDGVLMLGLFVVNHEYKEAETSIGKKKSDCIHSYIVTARHGDLC